MPSLKEFNVKLASLANTRKMTKTMKMVSASKLRRAQDAQKSASSFAMHVRQLIGRLAASVESAAHPLLEKRPEGGKALVLVLTSDKGLCAGFNNNLCKQVHRWIDEHRVRFDSLEMSFCGRRGYMHFRKQEPVREHYEGSTASPDFGTANKVAADLMNGFLEREFDEVYLAYNQFINPLTQRPVVRQILPVEPDILEGGEALEQNYIFEPGILELLNLTLPKAVTFQVHFALLENAAGEHGARMTAMDNATTNANKLIDRYTLLRNRARQAAITTEMIEIVSGAEAL